MKRHCCTLLLLLFTFCGLAHTSADNDKDVEKALKQINEIKMNTEEYLYSEAARVEWQDAYETAKEYLKEEIEAWLQTLDEDVTSALAKSEESILQIKTRRGELFRAFLYVKKKDIVAAIDGPMPTEKSESKQDSSQKEQVESNTAKQQDEPSHMLTNLERTMLGVSTRDDITDFLNMRSEIIEKHGTYRERPQSGTYYLFIYNRDGEVPAVLLSEEGQLTNLSTMQPDDFSNYKGCGGYWFILK